MDVLARHFDRLLAGIFIGGFVLFVASAFTGAGGDLIVGDAVEYFEYARSVAVEERLPVVHIKYPSGVALIGSVAYAPVVLIGKALTSIGMVSPSERWLTGWALPQQIAFCLPFFVLAWVACRANVRMLVRLGYDDRTVRPMILFWIVSTNVGFFMLKEPAMSESATYATLSLYYWALVEWFYRPADVAVGEVARARWMRRAVALGVFLGLAGMVRQQNILHCFALPLMLVAQRRGLSTRSPEWRNFRAIPSVAVTAVVSALLFVIPWIVWYAADGKLQLFSYGEEHFNFLSPRPLDALFHPGYHGLFVWHPAFAVAALGLVPFVMRRPDIAPAWLVPMALQFYLVVSWYWLSYGASIGHRGFFPLIPLLVAGWVAAGDYALRRGWERPLLVLMVALTLLNAVITALLVTGRLSTQGIPPGA